MVLVNKLSFGSEAVKRPTQHTNSSIKTKGEKTSRIIVDILYLSSAVSLCIYKG